MPATRYRSTNEELRTRIRTNMTVQVNYDGREGPFVHASKITRSYDAKDEVRIRRTKLVCEELANEARVQSQDAKCEALALRILASHPSCVLRIL